MSRLGRYVGRARGRALRAAGVPRTPNLPSGRALARRAVRDVTSGNVTGRRRSTGRTGPADDVDDVDADERVPDNHTADVIGVVGLVVTVLLWAAASCGPPATYRPPPPTNCVDKVIWHDTRVSDC